MITCEAVREIALSLPGAEEQNHWGRPSFRVRKRIFATLWEEEQRSVLKLPRTVQLEVVASSPETFSMGPWQKQGWTMVDLVHVDADQFRDLMITAWRGVVSKRVAAAYDGGSGNRRSTK